MPTHPALQTAAAALIPDEPDALQADLAAYLNDAAVEWMGDMGLLRDDEPMVGAVDDRLAQRNDYMKKVA